MRDRGGYGGSANPAFGVDGEVSVQSNTVKDMAWRSLVVLGLPVVALGCPLDDPSGVTTTTDMATTSVAETTTTNIPDPTTEGSSSGDTPPPATSSSSGSLDSSSSGDIPTTTNSTSSPGSCGNNVIEGDEFCDLTQLNGETCESLGFEGGSLGCLLTCDDYNLLGCFICGNEVIDIAEDCEETVPKEITCVGLGFEAGDVTCGADCLYDTSECSICGDGIQQGPEQCDGIDFGGETCASIGFDAGNLGCNLATCQYVYTGCMGGQYFQNFEGGAPLPLEFMTGGSADWFVDAMSPIDGSFSGRAGDIGEGQNNFMSLDASFAIAGDISFLHAEDSEGTFDFLQFYMDGVLQMEWSGNNAPATFMVAVPAGAHTFEWRYDKDGVVSVGQDTVWVDNITLTGGVPI